MIETLAMVGTPLQWALIAVVALLVFSPSLVPVIARVLGRMVRTEVRRRYGITLRSAPPNRPAVTAAPMHPDPPTEYRHDEVPPAAGKPKIEEQPDATLPADRLRIPVWSISALVLGAIAVLLWLLLHWR